MDTGEDLQMQMVDYSSAEAPGPTQEMRGTVKWFNAVKGFGFVTPADGSNDAFLHLSVLRDAGYQELQPGATITCEVCKRAKGLQVTRIVDVDSSTAKPVARPLRDAIDHVAASYASHDDSYTPAAVKWFNAEKGYGFCVAGRQPARRFRACGHLAPRGHSAARTGTAGGSGHHRWSQRTPGGRYPHELTGFGRDGAIGRPICDRAADEHVPMCSVAPAA